MNQLWKRKSHKSQSSKLQSRPSNLNLNSKIQFLIKKQPLTNPLNHNNKSTKNPHHISFQLFD